MVRLDGKIRLQKLGSRESDGWTMRLMQEISRNEKNDQELFST